MVSDLFSRFLPSGNGSTIYGDHPLLLLLSFLPEQLRTIPGLTVQARDRAREKLSEEIPQVLRLVTAYLDSEVHCVSSLRCLRSWLDLHPFSEYIVQFPELLDTLFRYLADVQYANVTADIIVQVDPIPHFNLLFIPVFLLFITLFLTIHPYLSCCSSPSDYSSVSYSSSLSYHYGSSTFLSFLLFIPIFLARMVLVSSIF